MVFCEKFRIAIWTIRKIACATLSAAAQLIFAHEKALVSYIRVLQKSSQFTRAIRKTASAMLSAAAQLIFAHNKALPS